MAAPIRSAGVAYLKRDGVPYDLRGSLTIQPLSTQKEGVAGLDGVHGYKETPVVPYISAEITPNGALLKAMQTVTNATITAECADGTVYVLRGAWFSGLAERNAGEGTVTLKFEGMSCQEMRA